MLLTVQSFEYVIDGSVNKLEDLPEKRVFVLSTKLYDSLGGDIGTHEGRKLKAIAKGLLEK
jgi:hypothetical protein